MTITNTTPFNEMELGALQSAAYSLLSRKNLSFTNERPKIEKRLIPIGESGIAWIKFSDFSILEVCSTNIMWEKQVGLTLYREARPGHWVVAGSELTFDLAGLDKAIDALQAKAFEG